MKSINGGGAQKDERRQKTDYKRYLPAVLVAVVLVVVAAVGTFVLSGNMNPDVQGAKRVTLFMFLGGANLAFISLVFFFMVSSITKSLNLEAVEAGLRQSHERLSQWAVEAERRTKELTLLSEMSEMLQACDSPNEAFLVMSLFIPKMFGTSSGAIYMLNATRDTAESKIKWGPAPPQGETFGFEECVGFRKGGVYRVDDVAGELICQHVHDPKPCSYVCAPMSTQGKAFGLLYFSNHESGITREDHELVMTVSEHLTMALANIDLRDRLREQSVTDPLTKLFNRRFMEDMLEREVKRADRAGIPIGFIMMDIDHFKNINDTFGHEAGDRVLETIGVVLKTSIRMEDIACRYGGEEFLLLLPGSNLRNTIKRADDIREKVSKIIIEQDAVEIGPIRISGGVAVYPDDGDNKSDVIRRADAALYRAKEKGRNRVESWRPDTASSSESKDIEY